MGQREAGAMRIVAAALAATLMATSAGAECVTTEQDAVKAAPHGTIVTRGSHRAFDILHTRFNTQRQSVGYGYLKADRVVVMHFLDMSVGVFMSRDGCVLKESSAHLKRDNWVGVLEDLKLLPSDFKPHTPEPYKEEL